jgi:hypothetical protein
MWFQALPVVPCGTILVWEAHAWLMQSSDDDPDAEHAVAVDRFAREIVRFLNASRAARSRQLNANPLGRAINVVPIVIPKYD